MSFIQGVFIPESPESPNYMDKNIRTRTDIELQESIGYMNRLIENKESANIDDKIIITIRLFNHLISYPEILMSEPKFRNYIISSLSRIENTFTTLKRKYKIAEYDGAIKLFETSIKANVKHEKIQLDILSHLQSIRKSVNEYSIWLSDTTLKNTIAQLKQILQNIQNNPNYVIM
jgi:hypothetical protein